MIKIKKFRRTQTISSIVIFFLVFAICWYVTKFSIKDIQLSYWGIEGNIGWLWNSCLATVSISMCFNVYHYIEGHPRIQFKKILQNIFIIVYLSLFLTAIIDMNHESHKITALFYFFAYPMSIFIFAHLNRKLLKYKEWLIHTSISVSMAVISLLLIHIFNGMAIAETAHGIIAVGWNLWLLLDD